MTVTDKSTQIILNRFDSLDEKVDKLNTTVVEHVAKEESQYETLKSLSHTVNGNGQDGLKLQVDRLVQAQATRKWVERTLVGLLVAILSSFGYLLLQKWIK